MSRVNYFPDQFVLSDDLNTGTFNQISQSVLRTQAQLGNSGGFGADVTTYSRPGAGVFGSPQDYLTAVNFSGSVASITQLDIQAGKALSPSGEFIQAPAAFSISAGNNAEPILYGGVQIGEVTYLLEVASPTIRYVKLSYKEYPSNAKTDDGGVSHYTRYTSGFSVVISSVAPTSQEILLYTFIANASGQIATALTDKRLYVRTYVPASAVILNPITKPISTHYTAEDHIHAVGSATPTQTNPHGLTLSDIGGNNIGTQHMQTAHVTGLMLSAYTATSIQSYSASIVNGVGDYLSFYAPVAAVVAINGNFYSGSVVPLYASDVSATPGNYWVVINSAGTPQWISSSVIPVNDFITNPRGYPQYFPIAYCSVDSSGDITGLIDKRQFFTTLLQDVRVDTAEAYTNDAIGISSSLANNLNRIRYALGRALTGNAADWNAASYPLTDGGLLTDRTYHQHSGNNGTSFIINQNQAVDSNGYFGVEQAAGVTASLKYAVSSKTWELYSSHGTTLASASVGRLKVNNTGYLSAVSDTFAVYESDGVTYAGISANKFRLNGGPFVGLNGGNITFYETLGTTLASGSMSRLKINDTGYISAVGNIFSLYQSDGVTLASGSVALLLADSITIRNATMFLDGTFDPASSPKISYSATGDGTVTFARSIALMNITAKVLDCELVKVSSTQVVGARITGWATPPDPDRTQTWTTATIVDTEVRKVAQSLSALIADLKTHGLIYT